MILLRPSEEARIGERAAAEEAPAASLRAAAEAFLASAAEGLEEAAVLGEGTGTEAEAKSLSRFRGVSDLGFFLSDLEEAEEEAGEAAEAAGAEVGVRGLLLPSGLEEESEDLWREEKKRPLKTMAAAAGKGEFRRTGGGGQ